MSCSSEKPAENENQLTISCDVETAKDDKLIAGEYELNGAVGRSKEMSRSGVYSLKLDKDNPFGFSYTFENVKKGDVIEATVWRNQEANSGMLVISDANKGEDVYESSFVAQRTIDGWSLVKLFHVAQQDYDALIVYAFNGAEEEAYFDDFTINAYFNNSLPTSEYKGLEINISDSAYDTLSMFRDQALALGVITSDQKEYIDASINLNGKKVPVELRLKGDWTDHLESNKWSFRIKVRGDNAFKGMKTFSIQNPSTRSFMMEWFAHKLFEHEDVLTTRYIFVPVVINGEQRGVYALEEHFDKQLLEHRKRREGPIVKYDESGVWQLHKLEKNEHKSYDIPAFKSAAILPFKKNRTYKSPVLSKQFKVAQWQMERFRNHDARVDEYFDLESLAKYIALGDVLNGKHGMIWHNQRNYYNPVTQKLEPIAFDCYMDPNLLIGQVELTGLERKNKKHFNLIDAALSNEELEELYFKYIQKFSDKKYLEGVFKELKTEIASVEKLLSFEYPNVKLDKEFFLSNCEQVREQINAYKKYRKSPDQETRSAKVYPELPENVIFTDAALKINVESKSENGAVKLLLRNYHSADLEVIGYSTKQNKGVIIPLSGVHLKAINGNPSRHMLSLPVKPRRVYFKAKNCGEEIFKVKVNKWSSPQRAIFIRDKKNTNYMVANTTGTIVFSGRQSFSSDVFIPSGHKVVFEAGASLNLQNSATFLSESPVFMKGSKEEPIEVWSSDGTGNGFVVLSDKESRIEHVNFYNLNTVNKYDWTLTGAVTFYGGKVSIDHCSFANNSCEDGLNLIRCEFKMSNSQVVKTFSDGFDADFCKGTVSLSQFKNTGNDGIDFSGSKITIVDCRVEDAGDKGISGGEDSELSVHRTTIHGAHIAIASKDKSVVFVKDCTISKAKYAFSAYRKKPEYGPGRLEVESLHAMRAEELHLLEKGSILVYKNKTYEGTRKFDIDSMYMMYKK
jgi:hypothetical protein